MLSEDSKPHSSLDLEAITAEAHSVGIAYDKFPWPDDETTKVAEAALRMASHVLDLVEQYEEAIRDRDQATVWMAEARVDSHDLKEQLETQTEAFEVERTAMAAAQNSLAEQLEALRQAEETARAQERVGNEGDADAIRRDALRRAFYGDSFPASAPPVNTAAGSCGTGGFPGDPYPSEKRGV